VRDRFRAPNNKVSDHDHDRSLIPLRHWNLGRGRSRNQGIEGRVESRTRSRLISLVAGHYSIGRVHLGLKRCSYRSIIACLHCIV
jgi:hypothetical protein